MRKIFILLILLGILSMSGDLAWAAEKYVLEASSAEVGIGEEFELKVGLNQTGGGRISISGWEVPGIENFQVQGTSTSTQAQVINGVSAASTTTTYTLVPMQEGEYVLGPVQGTGGESNTVKVVVKGKGTIGILGGGGQRNVRDEVEVIPPIDGGAVFLILGGMVVGGLLIVGYMISKKSGSDTHKVLKQSKTVEEVEVIDESEKLDTVSEKSAEEIREELVDWLEKKEGKKLSHLTTEEIGRELEEVRTEKIELALSVLQACDLAIYAKKPVKMSELSNQQKNILKESYEK